MRNKFEFYDIVTVKSDKPTLKKINGCKGVIRGMAQNEETLKWGYGVLVYQEEEVWHVMEEDLQSTGRKANPENYYTGQSIKVIVDPKTGEGKLADEK